MKKLVNSVRKNFFLSLSPRDNFASAAGHSVNSANSLGNKDYHSRVLFTGDSGHLDKYHIHGCEGGGWNI